MENYLQQLVYGSKTLTYSPYMSPTAVSTVDLTAIGSASDHPELDVSTFQSVSVHARVSENPGTVTFSVVKYKRDDNDVLHLQEVEEAYSYSALSYTDGGSRHLTSALDFSVKGADVIKLVTSVISATEVDLWARAY